MCSLALLPDTAQGCLERREGKKLKITIQLLIKGHVYLQPRPVNDYGLCERECVCACVVVSGVSGGAGFSGWVSM